MLNAPFVAAEILNILVGSFGLVTVAPFTAVVAGLLYRFERTGSAPITEAAHAGQEVGATLLPLVRPDTAGISGPTVSR
jgi:hypothetical protein